MPHRLAALALAALPLIAHAEPFTVVLLGDSITSGTPETVRPSYAERLEDRLGPGFELKTVGCSGSSSLDWTTSRGGWVCGTESLASNVYEARALPALPADLVTLLLGTNDAIGFLEKGRVPPETYRGAVAEIAANLLRDGASQVMLLTPPPIYVSERSQSHLAQYRAQILELCRRADDAILCGPDVFNLLGPEDLEENVHPSASGHAKIASALHDAIRALAARSPTDPRDGSR